MITKLILKNFKSFEYAEIPMGPLTTLIGMNASGKSNIRDALRLLHGIGRGYTLSEAIGEKWGEAGYLEWKGIRGGAREMVYQRAENQTCAIGIEFRSKVLVGPSKGIEISGTYHIEIALDGEGPLKPKVKSESLYTKLNGEPIEKRVFTTSPEARQNSDLKNHIYASYLTEKSPSQLSLFQNEKSLLYQVFDRFVNERVWSEENARLHAECITLSALLAEMRFLDVSPDEMRKYSPPGQSVLTDRGENLSSVLETITEEPESKKVLLDWLRELPQQEIRDFTFYQDRQGFVLLGLVDSKGNSISADSASDGTLRLLAYLAALLSPKPAHLYFFEEIENGIHPSRLHILVQLLEQQSQVSDSQLIISTHSPQLLGYLNETTLQHASLIYRSKQGGGSIVKPILDIPQLQELLETQNLSELHESGWFEDMMELMEPDEEESETDEL